MGDVLEFPISKLKDGGRERIQQRRKRLGLNEPFRGEDLTMDHADPEHLTVETLEAGMCLPSSCA